MTHPHSYLHINILTKHATGEACVSLSYATQSRTSTNTALRLGLPNPPVGELHDSCWLLPVCFASAGLGVPLLHAGSPELLSVLIGGRPTASAGVAPVQGIKACAPWPTLVVTQCGDVPRSPIGLGV